MKKLIVVFVAVSLLLLVGFGGMIALAETYSFRYTTFAQDCQDCHQPEINHYPRVRCESCHNTEDWQDIVYVHNGFSTCTDCHLNNIPVASHYYATCGHCHTVQNWQDINFDHFGEIPYTDCQNCHQEQSPTAHYPGQCDSCHSTDNWTKINFQHIDMPDCLSCHTQNAPVAHYVGQCSDCHTTMSWAYISIIAACLNAEIAMLLPSNIMGDCV
jgi:Zn finger protein HypA/HybF involved in hydrogenase expression